MTTQDQPEKHVVRTPRWVWAAIFVWAAITPLQHLGLVFARPEGAAHTGMHISDSVIFLHAMDMFESDFASPYASCDSPWGEASVHYYPIPFLWMYGVLGLAEHALPVDDFVVLGFANGLALALLLWLTYRVMVTVLPQRAPLAFALYLCVGGLGGVGYLLSLASGWTNDSNFGELFFRFAMYDLLEGPRIQPLLLAPRLYYTAPLLLGYGSLLLGGLLPGRASSARPILAALCIFAATLINIRFGPLFLVLHGLAGYFLWGAQRIRVVRTMVWCLAGTVAGLVATTVLLRLNPVYADNAFYLIRRSMWLTPFLICATLHLGLAAVGVRDGFPALQPLVRGVVFGCVGYLAAFVLLYMGYNIYYGSYWPTADFQAAVRMSDFALVGLFAGAAFGWTRKGRAETEENPSHAFLALWLLGVIVVAISGFGQGWFLRLAPQRLMVLLGPPLCLLAAHGFIVLQARRPRLSRGLLSGAMALGMTSVAVGALCFQGSLGRLPGTGAFPELFADLVTDADAECMNQIGPGRVMAPGVHPSFGDIIGLRGNAVLHGLGAWDLADRPAAELAETVETFYRADVTEETRREIAKAWCVDWVYCPDTVPVEEAVVAAFDSYAWLEPTAHSGQARLYRVNLPDSPDEEVRHR